MIHTFRCGHPMSAENAVIRSDGYKYCRICRCENRRRAYHANGRKAHLLKCRVSRFPKMLNNARARLAELEAQAVALGLAHLVEGLGE